eukprot:g250.t1
MKTKTDEKPGKGNRGFDYNSLNKDPTQIFISKGGVKKLVDVKRASVTKDENTISMKEPKNVTNTVAVLIDQDVPQDSTEGTNSKRLRLRVATELKRRRSSIVASFRPFVPEQPTKSGDILEVLAVPIFLKGLLECAASLSASEVQEEITSALAEDFARRIIELRYDNDGDDSDTFPAMVIGALIKHLRKEKESEREKGNMARTLIAAFFEICDEVSDIVLAILFAVDANDLQWAANLMFVFMGLNRFMCFLLSITFKEPFWRRFEALLGAKSITDTYRLVTQGADAWAGSINMVSMRTYVLGAGLALESLPQMMLQLTIVMSEMKGGTTNQGILVAQMASVLASCLSIGLSFGSLSIDQIRSLKLWHPSGPILFTYAIASSITISVVSLIVYVPDVSMKILFGILAIAYLITVVIFLANIDENIFTFLFSTVNWKETLRDELWDTGHLSAFWGIPDLVGNHDANHAAHIARYRTCDLPWKKITSWLRSKKVAFLSSPPVWMTPEWFDNLTPEVKREVWTEPGELEALIDKVKRVCAEARG